MPAGAKLPEDHEKRRHDEFVELVNTSTRTLDLSGVILADGSSDRHVFASGTVGLLAGSREQLETYSRVAGLDGRFVIRDKWIVLGQGLLSQARARDYGAAIPALTPEEDAGLDPALRELTGETRDGGAWTASLSRESRALKAGVSMTDISPHFSADMGFIPRTDKMEIDAYVNPSFFADQGGWLQIFAPEVYYNRTHRHGGTHHIGARTDDELGLEADFTFAHSTEAGAAYYRLYTLHQGRAFPGQDRFEIWAETFRFAAIQLGGSVNYGGDVVFDEGVPGRSLKWDAWADLRFTPQLALSLSARGLTLDRSETRQRYVTALIPRLKLTYQHNRELSFRAIGEVDAAWRYDPAGVRVPSETGVTVDFLATSLLRPETVAYLGYGARLSGDGIGAARPERTSAFFKLSYLWQL